MRYQTSGLVGGLVILLLALLGPLSVARAGGNDCPALLPADAKLLSEFRLCGAGAGTSVELSACRDYTAGDSLFTVEFRGGVVPVALRQRAVGAAQDDEAPVTQTEGNGDKRGCDPTPPKDVSQGATYRGTGVCHDEHERPLPCSVYEGANARQGMATRYFVYYEPDGSGVRQVDALPAGPNHQAFEAEMAFQLGQALGATECCREEARGYVAHAAGLFPADSIYRSTLNALAAAPVASTVAEVSNCGTGSTPSLSASNNGP
jgi:hypothetical protein